MKKAIVLGTEGMTHPDSRRPQAIRPLCSRKDHKQSRLYPSHCAPGRHPASQDTDKENQPGHRTQDLDRKSLVSGRKDVREIAGQHFLSD